MKSTGSHTMPVTSAPPLRLLLAWVLALLLASVLAACGGGGTVPPTGVDIRPLSADFSNRKAVAYSPFRSSNRDTEEITDAMIREDLALLAQGGFTLLRLFDSSDKVAARLLRIIADDKLDFKVMLGAYIFSEKENPRTTAQVEANKKFNQEEVDRAVKLANDYKSIVLAVSVGNETLVSWSGSAIASTPGVVAGYIKYVRDRVTQPLTSDDNWAFYAKKSSEPNDPRLVIDAVDFVSMHTYPLLDTVPPAVPNWDWQQQAVPEAQRAVAMMDAAIEAAKSEYAAVRAHLDSLGQQAKPIIIGETGWKAVPVGNTANRAHPVNQKMYIDRLNAWGGASKASGAGPVSIVYFEAFDEPWKGDDDKWGLFTVARKARYVIQDPALYPASLWDVPPTYTDADAVYAPTIVDNVVTANRYTLYSDTATAGEVRVDAIPRSDVLADLKLQFFGWDSPATAFAGEFVGTAADGEGFHYLEVGPSPASYGWGLFATSSSSTDLSQFEASGRLNFRIKTTYPGKLRFGFLTGSGSTAYDVYVTLSNTNADGYGFVNDGQWHDVSIPISALKAGGAPSFGNNPTTAKFDLTKVTNPFVVNDVYDATGNTTIKGNKTSVFIDNIYWSK
jgi:exo-beta-1,3-glucanase (GH17 family)